MKVTRRMTQSPEAQAAILAQAQAMGISVEDFDTIERGERTMTHTLCEQCASPATETSGLCWPCSERKRLQAINAELLAALKSVLSLLAVAHDRGFAIKEVERVYNQTVAAIEKAEGN